MYCKEKITMSDESGKWLPYNADGSAHDCRAKNGNGNGNGKQQVTVEMVVKKLASIGITLDVERIMKE
jgi:hypothetical protein